MVLKTAVVVLLAIACVSAAADTTSVTNGTEQKKVDLVHDTASVANHTETKVVDLNPGEYPPFCRNDDQY